MMITYREITQPELLERLKDAGINVTTQTIRNWESANLITKPQRGNQYGGRWTTYSEYVLIECYAAHHLLSTSARRSAGPLGIKLSPEILAKARNSCRFHSGWLPPRQNEEKKIVEHVVQPVTTHEEQTTSVIGDDSKTEKQHAFNNLLKYVPFSYESKIPFTIAIDKDSTFYQALDCAITITAELVWFKYLCEGAQKFFPQHIKGEYQK